MYFIPILPRQRGKDPSYPSHAILWSHGIKSQTRKTTLNKNNLEEKKKKKKKALCKGKKIKTQIKCHLRKKAFK